MWFHQDLQIFATKSSSNNKSHKLWLKAVKGKPKICTLKFYITQKLFQRGSLNDSVLSQYKWEFQLFVKCDLSIFKVKQFGVV